VGNLTVDNFNSKILVISVNWNSGQMLSNCVNSVLNFGEYYVEKFIIVDNGSKDHSVDILPNNDLIHYIRVLDNLGFGKACNLGAQQSQAEYLLFLNPDAAVFPNTLEKVLAYMQDLAHADVGICGIQLIDESGHVSRSCARFPTPWGFVAHAFGLDKVFPRIGYFMAEWAHDNTRDVEHVIGAFYMVRREVFDSLNGFDERFFVYLEDLDFSYRARQAGWRSVYLADTQAFHAGGGTSNQIKARRLFYSLRSRLLYAFKHFSWSGAVLVMLTTLLVEPLSRSALAVVRRSWPSFKETWQGYGMLWRWLPQWWFKGVTR
jgi:GT2 family glycosyltransferase